MWMTLVGNWQLLAEKALTLSASAFLVTVVLVVILIPLAPQLGLIDRPDKRKVHAVPTPAVGGLAIALGSLPIAMFAFPTDRPLLALVAASVLLLTEGVVDDLFNLRWKYRLCCHAAAALVLVYYGGVKVDYIGLAFGVWDYHQLGSLAMPLTVLATTGLINALNMIDGIDGLAGSLTMATLAMLGCAGLYVGNSEVTTLAVMLMGAVAGFLIFNLRSPLNPTARVFLGNAGSEFLGLVIAWSCFRLTQSHFHPVAPVLAPFLFAIPVIDCLVLMVRRMAAGRSPFSADRDHLHHLLADAGFSIPGVIGVIVSVSLAIGLLASIALINHAAEPCFVAAFIALLVGYFALTAKRERAVRLFGALARMVGQPRALELARQRAAYETGTAQAAE
jgi:UDP-GlcNAc:undecaprenyl-phosphate/decaprenyl-phosphate GlcNAc-1-phosphate transferase